MHLPLRIASTCCGRPSHKLIMSPQLVHSTTIANSPAINPLHVFTDSVRPITKGAEKQFDRGSLLVNRSTSTPRTSPA